MRTRKALGLASVAVLVPVLTAIVAPAASAAPVRPTPVHTGASTAQSPVTFARNTGQAAAGVRYVGESAGVQMAFSDAGVVLHLGSGRAGDADVSVALRFVDANRHPAVTGAARSPVVVNDFHNSDPAKWQTNVPTFREVVYRDLWPGIDASFSDRHGTLKYSFTVAAGANADDIRLAYAGADRVAVDRHGELAVTTGATTLYDESPVSYLMTGGDRTDIATRYRLLGRGLFGFTVAPHSTDTPLVVDPGLDYSTFLGGTDGHAASTFSVGTDAAGDEYIFGQSASPDFPTTADAYQRTLTPETGDDFDPVDFTVTKLDPAGRLVYSTFVGGSRSEGLAQGAVRSDGTVYVTGESYSPDFPTSAGAYRSTPFLGDHQGVAFELDRTGSHLVYSTYLAPDLVPGSIQLVTDGSVVVVGNETADYAPTTAGAFQSIYPGGSSTGYAVRLNPSGSGVVFATYLGAPVTDQIAIDSWPPACTFAAAAVDDTGASYLTGGCPAGFPVTTGEQPTGIGSNSLLVKLDPSGQLDYATYISNAGDSQVVQATALTLDHAGNAYVAVTAAPNAITVTADAYEQQCRTSDASPYCVGILEYDPAGRLVYGTYYVAPNGHLNPRGIAVDSAGRIYLVGDTNTGSNMPVTPNAYSTTPGDYDVDFFVAVLSKGSLLYSSYFGGTGSACLGPFCGFTAGDIVMAPDPVGTSMYLGGTTTARDFPVTAGALQGTYPGGLNTIWAARLDLPDLSEVGGTG